MSVFTPRNSQNIEQKYQFSNLLSSAGTYNYIFPQNVSKALIVLGGANGGGGTGDSANGGGGGTGGISLIEIDVILNKTYTITCGLGGYGGGGGGTYENGINGSYSSFDNIITSTGGGGGTFYSYGYGSYGYGGAGGSGNLCSGIKGHNNGAGAISLKFNDILGDIVITNGGNGGDQTIDPTKGDDGWCLILY